MLKEKLFYGKLCSDSQINNMKTYTLIKSIEIHKNVYDSMTVIHIQYDADNCPQ